MVGFIGALSSSLCILILVFITLLLSYIDSLLPETSLFKLNETTERLPIASYFIHDNFKPEIGKALTKIELENNEKSKAAMIGCTAGFDISEETAINIMAYNAIKILNFNLNIDVKIYEKPIFNDQQLNYCFVDFDIAKDKVNN